MGHGPKMFFPCPLFLLVDRGGLWREEPCVLNGCRAHPYPVGVMCAPVRVPCRRGGKILHRRGFLPWTCFSFSLALVLCCQGAREAIVLSFERKDRCSSEMCTVVSFLRIVIFFHMKKRSPHVSASGGPIV